MNDINETSEQNNLTGSFKTSEQIKSSMQGVDYQPNETPHIPDQKFFDKKGHDIAIRTYAGDHCWIRAYDQAKTPNLPEIASYADSVGNANVTLEKDDTGKVQKACINDIEVPNPEYKGAGVGSMLLETAENYAEKSGAKEIYGRFTPKEGEEKFLHDWYENRGYKYRQGAIGGQEIYKNL